MCHIKERAADDGANLVCALVDACDCVVDVGVGEIWICFSIQERDASYWQ